MPLKITSMTFTSPIFDSSKREGVISRGLTRKAKRFKKLVVDTQVNTAAKGVTYPPRRGADGLGFTRAHRASRRGDPPAPDTMNLVRSTEDNKTSPTTHKVYVNDSKAPYGKYLVRPRLDRPIMSQALVDKFQSGGGKEEDERMVRELGGTQ